MSDLNDEEVSRHAKEIQKAITKLITSREKSREATCGAIISLANILVMMTTIVSGSEEKAIEIVTTAISRAFKAASEHKQRTRGLEVMVFEINRDPKPPGAQPKV